MARRKASNGARAGSVPSTLGSSGSCESRGTPWKEVDAIVRKVDWKGRGRVRGIANDDGKGEERGANERQQRARMSDMNARMMEAEKEGGRERGSYHQNSKQKIRRQRKK